MIGKVKYEYILSIWKMESERNNTIENKSKFLLTVTTAILGGIILKIDLIIEIINNAKGKSGFFMFVILSLVLIMNISFVLTVFWILKTIKIKIYRPIFPIQPLKEFYDKESKFFKDNSEDSFYDAMGKYILSSLEYNRDLINDKSVSVQKAWISLIIGIAITVIILILYIISFAI